MCDASHHVDGSVNSEDLTFNVWMQLTLVSSSKADGAFFVLSVSPLKGHGQKSPFVSHVKYDVAKDTDTELLQSETK